MTVKTVFIVERKGEDLMTFTTKKEADAYDKMLDISDEIFELISGNPDFDLDDNETENLSIFLAKNKETLRKVLNGQKLDKIEKDINSDKSK